MFIENGVNQGFFGVYSKTPSSKLEMSTFQEAEKFAPTTDPNDKILPVQAIHQIRERYDLRNISAREIDMLAKDLKDAGLISDENFLALSTYGAEFLSNLPGSYFSEEALNEKGNLHAIMAARMGMSDADIATEAQQERLLGLIEKFENGSLKSELSTATALTKARMDDKTMAELLTMQEITNI